jgi:hypothetical protein
MNLRIYLREEPQPDPTKSYLERLVKLIPGEVIALYMAGKQVILGTIPPIGLSSLDPNDKSIWLGWTVFCLIAIVLVRAYATRTPDKPPQWPAVLIAAFSYLVWVYSMGDVFTYWDVWDSRAASLVMLGWTFLVPLIYKGD